VPENTTAVTTVTASDPDAGTTFTYSITGGADAARFAINASTGALSFVTAPNYEAPSDANADNVYDVQVQVSDGALTATQAIEVAVTHGDLAAPPSIPPVTFVAPPAAPIPVTSPGTDPGAGTSGMTSSPAPVGSGTASSLVPASAGSTQPASPSAQPAASQNGSQDAFSQDASSAELGGLGKSTAAALPPGRWTPALAARSTPVQPDAAEASRGQHEHVTQGPGASESTGQREAPVQVSFDLRLQAQPWQSAPLLLDHASSADANLYKPLTVAEVHAMENTAHETSVELQTLQVGVTMFTFAGIWWALRIPALAATLLTSLPAWRSFDPLPILDRGSGEYEDDDVPPTLPSWHAQGHDDAARRFDHLETIGQDR
jgi:hypothetical protein